ncbi:NUDIX domain-containing protein [Halovenus rubra]|uniref:NUDIX domain-containing protein n=2 Tax=Halovenus rubra TaxID=869890 RepID=A0ACC7E1T5_9EURY|nr:NUDIX domain-containing protein [Halovenus rubra]
MSRKYHYGGQESDIDTQLSLADPQDVRSRENVVFATETQEHETFDYCASDIAGNTVLELRNDDDKLLLLIHDGHGIAVAPHGDVEEGEDWAAAARREIEAVTGISIALDNIEAVTEVNHVVSEDGKPHRTTERIIFSGHPVDGEIQDCKQSAQAGSDDWRAAWVDGLPEDIEVPPGGPGNDLQLILD